jgi:hypothetical protein
MGGRIIGKDVNLVMDGFFTDKNTLFEILFALSRICINVSINGMSLNLFTCFVVDNVNDFNN